MKGYFVNFIKTGNPNGPDLPDWKPNTGNPNETVYFLKIGDKIELLKEQDREQMEFFDDFYK